LKFLLKRAESKPWLIRWMLCLQYFDLEIHDRSRTQNLVANHLSRIKRFANDASSIRDDFPNESLLTLSTSSFSPSFANIVNYLVTYVFPPLSSKDQCDKLKSDARYYIWDYS